MVDVINILLAVDQADEILDNLDDILLGEDALLGIGIQTQLGVDAEAAHLAQVIAFLAEEQVGDYLTRTVVIGRLGIAQLAVDEVHRLLATVTGVLSKRVKDNLVVSGIHILAVKQHGSHARVKDIVDVFLCKLGVAVDDHIVTLNAYNLAGILVHKVLAP